MSMLHGGHGRSFFRELIETRFILGDTSSIGLVVRFRLLGDLRYQGIWNKIDLVFWWVGVSVCIKICTFINLRKFALRKWTGTSLLR